MALLLKLEYVALFALAVFLFTLLHLAWWWFLVLILLPDVGMLGYAINPQIGAFTYNLTHWLVVAIGCYFAGILLESQLLTLAGVIMFAHSSLDRILGYGLKYTDSFKHTHLGNL